jgi:hypothetical protein
LLQAILRFAQSAAVNRFSIRIIRCKQNYVVTNPKSTINSLFNIVVEQREKLNEVALQR